MLTLFPLFHTSTCTYRHILIYDESNRFKKKILCTFKTYNIIWIAYHSACYLMKNKSVSVSLDEVCPATVKSLATQWFLNYEDQSTPQWVSEVIREVRWFFYIQSYIYWWIPYFPQVLNIAKWFVNVKSWEHEFTVGLILYWSRVFTHISSIWE